MDLQSTKIELAKLVLSLENEALLDRIKNLLSLELQPAATNQEKLELETGIQQLDRGERIALEDFLKKVS